jgi:WD40 repeat protein
MRFALAPHGDGVAVVDENSRLVFVRLGERPRVLLKLDSGAAIQRLQFSPDGLALFVSTTRQQFALNLETSGVLNMTTENATGGAAFSQDFRTMITKSVRDRGYNEVLGILGILVTASEYGGAAGFRSPEVTVNRIDRASGMRVRLLKKNLWDCRIFIDASGNRVVVLRNGSPNVLVFEGVTSKPSRSLRVPCSGHLTLAPDGHSAAYSDWRTKQVITFDLDSGRELRRYAVPGDREYPVSVEYSGDGSLLLGGTAKTIVVWDSSSGQVLMNIDRVSDVRDVVPAISLDGTVVAVPTKDSLLLYYVPSLASVD